MGQGNLKEAQELMQQYPGVLKTRPAVEGPNGTIQPDQINYIIHIL